MKTIVPITRPFRARVAVPGSKSITNRALVLAALAAGDSALEGVLLADDTERMLGALAALGYRVAIDRAGRRVAIGGCGRRRPGGGAGGAAVLDCGNSGTTIRFLTAMLTTAQTPAETTLDGIARMRQRPIGQLVEQLRALGATVEYAGREGYPPVRVRTGAAGLRGGTARFQDAQSSQYISAVLMAAPYAVGPVTIELVGPVTSEPYVAMTLRMMEQWGYQGVAAEATAAGTRYVIAPGAYRAGPYVIEPDASNASYFLAAAALTPGASVTVEGLGKGSLQGDVAFADVLHQMGAGLLFGRDFVTVMGTGSLRGIDIDMNAIPDMVQTLAVAALFAQGPTHVRNVANLRVKETDRLAALETELGKFGATVVTTADSITITPPEKPLAPAGGVATYDDHRMAMAFALAGLRIPGVAIQNPECTAKTYPEYFADLARAVTSPETS